MSAFGKSGHQAAQRPPKQAGLAYLRRMGVATVGTVQILPPLPNNYAGPGLFRVRRFFCVARFLQRLGRHASCPSEVVDLLVLRLEKLDREPSLWATPNRD